MNFKKIYLEITNQCNLSCSFCSKTSRPPRRMTLEEFSYAARQVRSYTQHIYLHVKGEPLLHPSLGDFLDIAWEEGLQVNLTTNGTLLSSKQALLLSKPALRQVNISLHSLPEQHGQHSSVGFTQQEYLESCIRFAKAASNRSVGPCYTVFRMWNLDSQNAEPFDKEKSSFSPKQQQNQQILQFLQAAFSPAGPPLTQTVPCRSRTLMSNVFFSQETSFVWPSLSHPHRSNEGFCHGGRRMLAVLADGSVVPCCLDGDGIMELGNLFQTPLSEILATRRYQEMVQGLSRRLLTEPLCQRCSYRARFDRPL